MFRSTSYAILVGWLLTCPLSAQESSLPPADPPYYRVRFEPSSEPGELIYGVSFTVWIPPNVPQLRGVIVHQHGCGAGACKGGQTAAYDLHWQALARRHQCALLGPSYEQPDQADCHAWCDPRNGSDKVFQRALRDLSVQTKHPELETVPWALWGHSGGGTWAGGMLMLHPDRIVTAWLRSGAPKLMATPDAKLPPYTVPQAAHLVPVMCNLGTKEGVTVKDDRFSGVWGNMESFFKRLRENDGLTCVSVDPLSSHDCGNQRYLAIPWFDVCLSARLPDSIGAALKPMPREGNWLAPLLGEEALPAKQFNGDARHAVWLPNAQIASAWTQYNRTAVVSDSTLPPAPTNVQLVDGKLSWDAEADFESGLAGFVILRDGQEIGRLPDKPAKSIGLPIFQRNSYHDTPSLPLEKLVYKDETAEPGRRYVYAVAALNTAGLQSNPAPAQTNAYPLRKDSLK